MTNELPLFVKEALTKGIPRKDIQAALEKSGWQTDEVRQALASYAETDFPIPVPRRRPYVGAREAFMYLLTFLTLYWSAWSLGQMLYQFINRAFPDPVSAPYGDMGSYAANIIRMDVASLIIAFPVFLLLSWILNKAITKDTDRRASKIRKWLTYLTLFVAAGVIIGDLIALVFNLLSGEVTARFLLKVLTVGGIASAIFGYYLIDLRKEEKN